ncbi:hypothetical protein Ngar_c29160 [Candidatus Nitrososphaera gargensis Ga9.2]|uniref:Uncharacterized protein n=1 Tax=Nitrososphaera gargensis (strain Ga9.2) TaxID=1237085 RepID=K0IIR5_NITGG|nr:hypothetical protein Ngar_c29160 [Candidatus Nitrososphaera gargensis Ga9.2]
MKMANIRFDDPEDLGRPSRVFIELMMRLELLDYARRYFERKGDSSSLKRAGEIRKFYKQTICDSVYIVRSIIPDELMHEHSKLFCKRIRKERD